MRHDLALPNAAAEIRLPPWLFPEEPAAAPPSAGGPRHAAQAEAAADIGAAPQPAERGEPARTDPPRQRGWKAALFGSLALHAAAVLALLAAAGEAVRIEGSDQAGIVMQGDGPDDQRAAGLLADARDVTTVTLVAMLAPKPVAAVEAVAVARAETIPEEQPSERLFAEPDRVQAETADEAEAVAPAGGAARIDPSADVTPLSPVAPSEIDPAPTGQAFAAAGILPVLSSEVVASEAAPVRPPPQEAVRPTQTEPVQASRIVPVEAEGTRIAEAVVAEAKPKLEKPAPPALKPSRERKALKAREKQDEQKPAAAKAQEKPAKAKNADGRKAQAPRGLAGSDKANARRGSLEGQADGKASEKGANGRQREAGNASASNYPGLVAAKLRRAARSLSGSMARRGGDARVAFVVQASGSVSGVRIVASSGSPELDRAAIAIVQRAAPFPPIPAAAGRSSWSFTLPIGTLR